MLSVRDSQVGPLLGLMIFCATLAGCHPAPIYVNPIRLSELNQLKIREVRIAESPGIADRCCQNPEDKILIEQTAVRAFTKAIGAHYDPVNGDAVFTLNFSAMIIRGHPERMHCNCLLKLKNPDLRDTISLRIIGSVRQGTRDIRYDSGAAGGLDIEDTAASSAMAVAHYFLSSPTDTPPPT